MKTYTNLYDSIISWENLLEASRKASLGKRYNDNVVSFNRNLSDNLVGLRHDLASGTYTPGPYSEFTIYGPKKRKISAAPFRDRVAHHALCNIIMPIFEKTFIDTSFANRKGKGTHRAVRLCQKYMQREGYYLLCDVVKYFPSIDHEILKTVIRKKVRCEKTLRLIDKIIDFSNPQESVCLYFPGDELFTPFERKRGLPIGNLTSQYFANIYLTPLDHYIQETLKCRRYIRYVDDMLLFDHEKSRLAEWYRKLCTYLDSYRLALHGRAQPIPVHRGVSFLGYRVFPTTIRLKRRNLVCALRRQKRNARLMHGGLLNVADYKCRLFSWLGHAMHADVGSFLSDAFSEWIEVE